MDIKNKQEILTRLKKEPKFINKVIKKYNLDLEFYRQAIFSNIEVYDYIKEEYKNDIIIIDLILKNASTSHLNFNYKKIIPHNDIQNELLTNIKINICYLDLYKIIYGYDKRFKEEVRINSVSNDNSVIAQINDLLKCLDEEERYYIIFKYGLNNGCPKCWTECAKYFKTTNLKIKKFNSSIITKIRKIITNSHLYSIGFYDEVKEDDLCKK